MTPPALLLVFIACLSLETLMVARDLIRRGSPDYLPPARWALGAATSTVATVYAAVNHNMVLAAVSVTSALLLTSVTAWAARRAATSEPGVPEHPEQGVADHHIDVARTHTERDVATAATGLYLR